MIRGWCPRTDLTSNFPYSIPFLAIDWHILPHTTISSSWYSSICSSHRHHQPQAETSSCLGQAVAHVGIALTPHLHSRHPSSFLWVIFFLVLLTPLISSKLSKAKGELSGLKTSNPTFLDRFFLHANFIFILLFLISWSFLLSQRTSKAFALIKNP